MEAEKITIRRFLEKYISNDYALSVLCYKLRLEIEHHNYSLKSVPSIIIEQQYIPNPVVVVIKNICSSQIDTFAFLLSIRAITIDRSLLCKCDDDHLLFSSLIIDYKWLDYVDVIQKMSADEEFSNLLKILKELRDSNTISSDTLLVYNSFTIDPGQNNLTEYYKYLSSSMEKVSNGVIPDHYYLENDNLSGYTLSTRIKYVGDGAFAYCQNLCSFIILSDKVLFGLFPFLECNKLKEIIVPDDAVAYYKEALPYYKDIIISQSEADGTQTAPEDEKHEIEQEPILESKPELKPELVTGSEISPNTEIHVIQVPDNNDEPLVEIGVINDYTPVFSTFDSSKLKNVFDSKATTYKYFWYMGFLTILKEKQITSIPIVDIEIMMITKAWHYLYHFELDFGTNDQLKKISEEIRKKTYLIENAAESVVFNQLNYHIDSLKSIIAPLSKNVPFRFISPWIKYTSDQEVMESSRMLSKAPYALYDDRIIFDESRLIYFTEHYDEQISFIKESLKEYLRKYNNALKMLLFLLD